LLGRWKKESDFPEDESTATGCSAILEAELKRINKENKQLKLECEILKKAA
jgi:transposase